MKLSDSFPDGYDPSKPDVEVKVHMHKIRPQYGSRLLTDCKVLSEYSWFIEAVRKDKETLGIEPAIDKAIEDMPDDFELKAFLAEHKSEVKNMCLTEYNEAETMEMFKEEGIEEGIKEGIKQGIKQGISLRDKQKIEEMLRRGKTVQEIADFCNYPFEQVKAVEDSLRTATM
ncbi:MAG: hypothetical protein K6D90_03250 [Lachnospiraceae bacterium]|nr:hypothetical protein [Lachnospiraceae bacterium]